MIEYVVLKEKPREFLAATGLTLEEFECLLPAFERHYHASAPKKPKPAKKKKPRASGGGRKARLATGQDKLLFILFYQKTFPLQTRQGLHFGLSQPQTNYWIHSLLPVLRQASAELGMKPEREGEKVAELPEASEGGANLSIDASERGLQRPVNVAATKGKV